MKFMFAGTYCCLKLQRVYDALPLGHLEKQHLMHKAKQLIFVVKMFTFSFNENLRQQQQPRLLWVLLFYSTQTV